MPVMQFRVKDINVEDNSRVPDFLRTFPKVDLSEVVAEREWVFDHDMGLWTVNGQFMDPTVTSAFPKQGTAEIRSEEHTSELQSLMRISYAVFCLKTKK